MAENPPPVLPNVPNPEPAVAKRSIDWTTVFTAIGFVAIAVLILGFIIYSISGSKGVLNSLADEKVARGLITFLIAIATVAIAIILALSAVISDPNAVKERFALGKEVLSILIGVLGTIVGFYFGSAITGQTPPLQVASAVLTNEQPLKGEKVTLVAFIQGGKPPYTYSITVDPSNVANAVKEISSTDGTIKQDLQISPDVQKETTATYVIDVRDSENKSTTYNKNGIKKFVVKLQQPPKT